MSAYLCEDEQFTQLAAYACLGQVDHVRWLAGRVGYSVADSWIEPEKLATFMANVLKAQNIVSLEARYSERADEYWPDADEEVTVTLGDITRADQISPVNVLKSVANYEYQACETDDFEQSKGALVASLIRKEAIGRLPGYEDAPWGAPHDFKEPAPDVRSLTAMLIKAGQ